MIDEEDLSGQEKLLKNLADEKRLRILTHVADGPVAAPELAEKEEFDIGSESLLYHLNRLENTGIIESSTVQGPYKRPRKEFRLSGNGRRLILEVVENDYHFEFREPAVAPE